MRAAKKDKIMAGGLIPIPGDYWGALKLVPNFYAALLIARLQRWAFLPVLLLGPIASCMPHRLPVLNPPEFFAPCSLHGAQIVCMIMPRQ